MNRNELQFHVAHIGINCGNSEEAEKTAAIFSLLFGFDIKVGNSSIFTGENIEIMKSRYLGKNGHIAIGTNNIDKAISKLKGSGYEVDKNTLKRDTKGQIKSVYLSNEIAGFALHLLSVS